MLQAGGIIMKMQVLALRAILICLVWSTAGPLLAQDDGVYWQDNYNEAIKEAKRTQKPIFVEFRCEA
jgi:hypothetical protein